MCGCCRCVFTFRCFPSFSIFGHLDTCVVVLYFVAFHLCCFLWLEEFIDFIFPSLFWSSTGLYVWCLMLRPGFHFAAFFAHRSSGIDAILIAKHHFILMCVSIQHGNLDCFHPFNGCRCASFHVLHPIFLFNFSCVNLFISVFHEGDVTVLIATATIRSFTI